MQVTNKIGQREFLKNLDKDLMLRAKLALYMGYRCTGTLEKWVSNKKIPENRIAPVEAFLKSYKGGK